MSRTFLKKIPADLILEFLSCIGFQSIHETRTFDKSFFSPKALEKMKALFPRLEPYFRKNTKYILEKEVNSSSMIRLLRTLLKEVGMCLDYMQKGEEKMYVYQLKSLDNRDSMGS